MKMISLTLLTLLTTTLLSDKNWIQIEPLNKTQTAPQKTKHDINLSKILPINNMMQKASIIKQLIDATSTKKKEPTNNKNWIALNKDNQ
ncbi:hypothetical protein [Sulfurimonas sp.]|jgi:hypothetical protein|uniref:hypothetical protein n=1 Tax=Sulfurimonas sp. TaxID=2022749 RepID=UPI0025D02147|nr:hypothetical protein [Sulfurimonas sp.]MBT5933949.1 hypothetical protein [Sulfurimonas sp.]